MRRLPISGPIAGCLLVTAALAVPTPAGAQDAEHFLALGDPAPDFELTGATRYGILKNPVRLSDYLGETVVLSFFFRVRTPG